MAAHQWKLDRHGEPEYDEPVDGHGGPRCERCGYWYCQHCHDGPPYPECEPEAEVKPGVSIILNHASAGVPIPFAYYDPATGLEVRGELLDGGQIRGRWMLRRLEPARAEKPE